MYLITPETPPPTKTIQRKIGGDFSCKNKFDKKLENWQIRFNEILDWTKYFPGTQGFVKSSRHCTEHFKCKLMANWNTLKTVIKILYGFSFNFWFRKTVSTLLPIIKDKTWQGLLFKKLLLVFIVLLWKCVFKYTKVLSKLFFTRPFF